MCAFVADALQVKTQRVFNYLGENEGKDER
jgi:hypothetical protein